MDNTAQKIYDFMDTIEKLCYVNAIQLCKPASGNPTAIIL